MLMARSVASPKNPLIAELCVEIKNPGESLSKSWLLNKNPSQHSNAPEKDVGVNLDSWSFSC